MKVVLIPVTQDDVEALRRIRATPEVARWWHELEPEFPLTDEPDSVRFTVRLDGEVVGMIQYAEEEEPMYRHAGIDLFLDPTVHGRGIGVDTVRTIALHLVRDRGHHRLTIDPAVDNAAAIRCYTKVGFRPVGVLRQYERDGASGEWHDGLLMDALASEIEDAAR